MPSIRRITIDQQLAEIGVQSTPAKMHIVRPRMSMTIKTESPKMEIDRKDPTFKVNWKKVNSERGLKAPMELTDDFKNDGKEGALRGAKTPGEDGDYLGDLRIPGNRLAQLMRSKSLAAVMKKKQLDLGLMPESSPEVVWDRGHLRINWSKHSIVIDWDGEYMPQVTIDPKYSIEIFLRTEPYFKIKVEEVNDPNMPGKYIDKAI